MDERPDKKTKPENSASSFRDRFTQVLEPTDLDVLCGRGAPIQSHAGNVRMRNMVSKYARRYLEAQKYHKQMIAEEALASVKDSDQDQDQKRSVRFLRKVDQQEHWTEVNDKFATNKVQHALRSFARKLEGKRTSLLLTSEGQSQSDSMHDANEKPRANTVDNLFSQNCLPPAHEGVGGSALEIDALQRANLLHFHTTHPSIPPAARIAPPTSLLTQPHTSFQLPSPQKMTPTQYHIAPRLPTYSAAEEELRYRISLRQMSSAELIRLVASERTERAQHQTTMGLENGYTVAALENLALVIPIAPFPQFTRRNFQRVLPSESIQRRKDDETQVERGEAPSSESSPKRNPDQHL